MTSADHLFASDNIIRNQSTGKREADPLPRLLAQLLSRAGEPATIERAVSRPWASALFEGRRHVILLRLEGKDALQRSETLRAGLAEAQWSLSGHFVADIMIDRCDSGPDGVRLDLSALTIRDW